MNRNFAFYLYFSLFLLVLIGFALILAYFLEFDMQVKHNKSS